MAVTRGNVTVTSSDFRHPSRADDAERVHTVGMQPSADEVREQLERMVASQPFAAAPRLRTFLRYVVERVLAGQGGQLKEYAIGVDVFERDAQYDPRIDSIVRVEAGRLRAKVDEYYGGEGAGDRVIVSIPRGSYVPLFETRDAVAPAPPPLRPPAGFRISWLVAAGLLAIVVVPGIAVWGPAEPTAARPLTNVRVVVLPFTHYATGGADDMLAARITDGVTTELARLNVVGVVSRTTARQFDGERKPLGEIAALTGAAEVIEGSVLTEGDIVRVRTRFVNGSTDLKTAVQDFDGRRDGLDELARRIAEALSASFQARRMQ
jgi:adenylate cyclase